jgi:hypothetical protein
MNDIENECYKKDIADKKIAVYTCNFGNYRNELKIVINNKFEFDKKIDYYIFTDNEKIDLQKWKIIHTPLLSSDETMNKYRWTSKYVKFVLPDILKEYDYVIWIDSNMMNLNLKYDNILNLINKYPLIDIFNNKHPNRNNIQEELNITIKLKLENIIPAKNFLEYIKDFKSIFSLPASGIFLRNTKEKTNQLFELCFQLMKDFKLKRDQNIYNYACSKTDIIPLVLPELKKILSE